MTANHSDSNTLYIVSRSKPLRVDNVNLVPTIEETGMDGLLNSPEQRNG
jgi:hypothetical protein